MKKIVAKLTTPFRSPPSSTSPSFSRFKSNTFLQPPSESSFISRQVSPKFLGEDVKKKSSNMKMSLTKATKEDMIDSKLRALENKIETKSFEEALDEELLLY